MRISIIGAGHVGRTLGRLFHDSGLCEIGDILNRSRQSAERAADFIGGGLPSSALGPLADKGLEVCAVHPVKSFADPETCIETFAGTFCAAEGDDRALDIVSDLFEGCGATVFRLRTEQKEIYHAATVFVCNYLTTLLDVGLKCFE